MTKTLTVQNFKGCQYVQLSPEGSLVVIAGDNGAGKSSFIDAFTELFDPKGTRLTPEPIRHGETEASASFEDTDLGVRITRTWKKNDAGRLEVVALDGAKYSKPADVIAKLTGGVIFDPSVFLTMDDRRQRDALLQMVDLPFDLDAIERERQAEYERRTVANRDVTRLRGAVASAQPAEPDGPDEEVSAQDILDQIRAAQDAQYAHDAAERRYKETGEAKARIEREIADLRERAHAAAEAHDRAWATLNATPAPTVPVDELRVELAAVEETNAAVRAKREWQKLQAELAEAVIDAELAEAGLAKVEQRKRDGLASATFPVDGLSVSDTGITFQGVPFSQVNRAAQLRVAFAVATAGTPDLRLVIVKEGDLLDSSSLDWVRSIAEERGYTVLVERDRDESRQIGFTIVDGQVEGATAPVAKVAAAARRERVDGCDTCATQGIVPPHDPSTACASGSRVHCTCEVCF